MPTRATVALFTRALERGRVKTRLAASIGDDAALALHSALLERTVAALRDAGDFDLAIHVDGAVGTLPAWRLPVIPQVAGDLGTRMAAATASIVAQGRVAVVVGSDCPLLGASHVRAAVAAIEAGADVVVNPAEDGGYVLIAMSRLQHGLFEYIAWGTDQVLETTRRRVRALGLVLAELETLWDVDDAAGYARYRALRSDSRSGRSVE